MANMPPTSNLFSIEKAELKYLAEQYGTPVYLIDEEGVINRFDELKHAVTKLYPRSRVALSYKTNSLLGLLSRLHEKGALAEVVSGDEIEIARALGVDGENIVFNGPVKTDEQLLDAFKSGMRVNCDHFDEIKRAELVARQTGRKQSVGLRLTFPELAAMNRFGFEAIVDERTCEAFEVIDWINSSKFLEVAGIHIHSATNVRDLSYFYRISNYALKFIQFLLTNFTIDLKWIDLGGGLAGILPGRNEHEVLELPSVEDYASEVIGPLLPLLGSLENEAELIFEPGRTLFEAFGGLLMRVVGSRGSKECSALEEIIVDAGLSMVPSAETVEHPIIAGKSAGSAFVNYKIYGSSCRQKDVLGHKVSLPESILGSPLLMLGTGAYSMGHACDFVNFKPGVLLRHSAFKYSWLRRTGTVEDKKRLEIF